MARSKISSIEARYEASLPSILNNLAKRGLNKTTAAKELGVAKNTLLGWIDRCKIEWPAYTDEHSNNRRKTLIERSLYTVEHQGVNKPLFEAAKAEGICTKVILERYKRGDRGEHLFRKVRGYQAIERRPDIEMTPDDWQLACALAREIGVPKAAKKFAVPTSMLTIVMKKRSRQQYL